MTLPQEPMGYIISIQNAYDYLEQLLTKVYVTTVIVFNIMSKVTPPLFHN